MLDSTGNRLHREQVLALQGLRLPAAALRQLQRCGIYCRPGVSLEHQHLARRYVVRGTESGGAVAGLGFYAGFMDEDGRPLSWLHRISTVGRNGLHAVVVAPILLRVQAFRSEQRYELLITRHDLEVLGEGRRPALRSKVLFHGMVGRLAQELWGKDRDFSGKVIAVFSTRGGQPRDIPDSFSEAVRHITAATCCIGCRHCHFLVPPVPAKGSNQ